jgi:hypothetical protein
METTDGVGTTSTRSFSLAGTPRPMLRHRSTADAGLDVSSRTDGGVQKLDEAEPEEDRGRGRGAAATRWEVGKARHGEN